MDYSIISFILMIVPLAIIIIVVVKKFPQLAVLDVDNVPEVKTSKKKDEVLKKRVEEKAIKSKNNLQNKKGVKIKTANFLSRLYSITKYSIHLKSF